MSQAAGQAPPGPATGAKGAAALELTVLAGELCICRLPAGSPAPAWAVPGAPTAAARPSLTSVCFTADETSVVCASELVPAGVTADTGWRALAVAGPMDLSLTGVLAPLAQPLAEAGLALFAVSTYNTDYLLVRASALEAAIAALTAAGHHVA